MQQVEFFLQGVFLMAATTVINRKRSSRKTNEPSRTCQMNGQSIGDTGIDVPRPSNEVATPLDVLVIGADFSGVYALHKLSEDGLNVKIYGAGSGYGIGIAILGPR